MSDGTIAVAATGVGKSYHIYARPEDRLKQAALRWRRTFYHEFWALRNVSFEVERGEAVGIVGRNGSGKSTLLQIVAGTVSPTEGEVRVSGRVSALLELGSGFNPEFTGVENVFMNGAILGVSRAEMEQRFDDIAAFADIGQFMHQPVKTYSSGMYARLAFAVAISIDPDILIVDEILAVGDIGFQQRCLARMRQLRDRGMTLLFVSHAPDAIRSTCQKALFLVDGRAVYFGQAERAIDMYLCHVQERSNQEMLRQDARLGGSIPFRTELPGNLRYGLGHAQIAEVDVLDRHGAPCRTFRFGEPITIEATLRAEADVDDLSVSFLVRDQTGIDLMGTTTFDERVRLPPMAHGMGARVRFVFENNLRAGSFGVSLAVHRLSSRDYSDNVLFDQIDGCIAFTVVPDQNRPVHYKYHHPVSIDWEITRNGSS